MKKRLQFSLKHLLWAFVPVAIAFGALFSSSLRHQMYCTGIRKRHPKILTTAQGDMLVLGYEWLDMNGDFVWSKDGAVRYGLVYVGTNTESNLVWVVFTPLNDESGLGLMRPLKLRIPERYPCSYGDVELKDVGTLHVLEADETKITYAFTLRKPQPALLPEKELATKSTEELVSLYQQEEDWKIRLPVINVLGQRKCLTVEQWLDLARKTDKKGLHRAILQGILASLEGASPDELVRVIEMCAKAPQLETIQLGILKALQSHPQARLEHLLALHGKVAKPVVWARAVEPHLQALGTSRLIELLGTYPEPYMQVDVIRILQNRREVSVENLQALLPAAQHDKWVMEALTAAIEKKRGKDK